MAELDRFALLFLKTALRQSSCPVCRIRSESETRYLDYLLWERVNDLETRARISESLGFCCEHTWQMLSMEQRGAALGNSIIYKDLVGQILRGLATIKDTLNGRAQPDDSRPAFPLRRRRAGASDSTAVSEPLTPLRRCRVCQAGEEMEAYAVVNLIRMLGDPEHQTLYDSSEGICLPHVRLAVKLSDSEPGLIYLVDSTRARLVLLQDDLAEFTRKQSWQHHHEIVSPAEQTAAERAAAFLVGASPTKSTL